MSVGTDAPSTGAYICVKFQHRTLRFRDDEYQKNFEIEKFWNRKILQFNLTKILIKNRRQKQWFRHPRMVGFYFRVWSGTVRNAYYFRSGPFARNVESSELYRAFTSTGLPFERIKTFFAQPYIKIFLSVVNGGYGNWTLRTPCDVSCGDGVEIWRRFCNNPEPRYNGRNCSELGISTEFRNCSRTPCPSKYFQVNSLNRQWRISFSANQHICLLLYAKQIRTRRFILLPVHWCISVGKLWSRIITESYQIWNFLNICHFDFRFIA